MGRYISDLFIHKAHRLFTPSPMHNIATTHVFKGWGKRPARKLHSLERSVHILVYPTSLTTGAKISCELQTLLFVGLMKYQYYNIITWLWH